MNLIKPKYYTEEQGLDREMLCYNDGLKDMESYYTAVLTEIKTEVMSIENVGMSRVDFLSILSRYEKTIVKGVPMRVEKQDIEQIKRWCEENKVSYHVFSDLFIKVYISFTVIYIDFDKELCDAGVKLLEKVRRDCIAKQRRIDKILGG